MNIFDEMNEIKNQFEGVIEKLHNHTEENTGINIIIDDSDHNNPIFVEIETDGGKSIRIGEEKRTDEGYRQLRITTADIIQHERL